MIADDLAAGGPATVPEPDLEDVMTTPIGFAELVLDLPLYPWQDDALRPLHVLVDGGGKTRRVKVSVAAPNGSGKSQRIVAAAALYWVSVHKRGRVVITTADGKQLNEQIYPSLTAHRARFPGWRWITSPNIKITTSTGGTINAFTTDDPGRAEGWHMDYDPARANLDGPLLIIVDEAKSVPEGIFDALDRCGYNVVIYVSSPGVRAGRFYESHTSQRDGFVCVQAGLSDCPHIPQAKIDDIIRTHGADSPFTRSTLYGEFMDSEKQARFDREGVTRLKQMSGTFLPKMDSARLDPQPGGQIVVLQRCPPNDPSGWLRLWELPQAGFRHVIAADVATGAEQQQGGRNPDRHSVGVLREAHVDQFGCAHNLALVARLIPPCHCSLDLLADRIAYLSRWYAGAPAAVEVNGPGLALIELLKARGVPLYSRSEQKPGSERVIQKPGWITSATTKPLMITEVDRLLREDALDVWCPHVVGELSSFVVHPDGTEAAEDGCHDDDVAMLWGAVRVRGAASSYRDLTISLPNPRDIRARMDRARGGGYGAQGGATGGVLRGGAEVT